MTCVDCKYLGIVFDHLKDHQNINEWRNCEYPLPFNVTPQAIPIGVEHNCCVYKRKSL